ncbi:sensor histidine kinase [Cellulomonas alba]|uniref:histidine kinase n=1 Tax=Cellulomonas alba TaxID=3053467 RepID=A0ABT7SF21_9CELL|nr:sensor histidine kinase [Cellulomonas alba]MDM7854162.1 sensor histidine kinase [Cellulomonas alba]
MSWRLMPAARAPLAAGAFALLAVLQAGGGSGRVASVRPALGEGTAAGPGFERPQEAVVGVLLALAATAPVALAGLWPVVAAALSVAATVLTLLARVTPTVGALAALATLLVLVGLRRPAWVVAVLVAPLLVVLPSHAVDRPTAAAVLAVAVLAGAAGVGWRLRREAGRRDAAVVAAQESELEHLARGERVRIARELHDVVAHHVSLIALQAEVARVTVPGLPEEGEKRLVAIGDTARTALTEMRRLLGVLREDVEAADAATRRPQPGIAELTDLVDDVRGVGPAGTRLIVSGAVGPLDAGTELTAYRIVQEALTNARRHAGGTAVDVELEYRPDRLVVEVRDAGPGPVGDAAADAGGHGLAGMRERVAMAGGTLTVGPGRVGGFVVHAELPLGGAA